MVVRPRPDRRVSSWANRWTSKGPERSRHGRSREGRPAFPPTRAVVGSGSDSRPAPPRRRESWPGSKKAIVTFGQVEVFATARCRADHGVSQRKTASDHARSRSLPRRVGTGSPGRRVGSGLQEYRSTGLPNRKGPAESEGSCRTASDPPNRKRPAEPQGTCRIAGVGRCHAVRGDPARIRPATGSSRNGSGKSASPRRAP